MSSLEKKLVLLTGASAGIGLACASLFAEQGARVVAVARSESRLRKLAAKIGGERVVPIAADVADGPSMEAMARRVLDGPGVPDVIVANAGIGLDAPFADTTDENLRRVFEVNVFGVVRTVRPFLAAMVARGSGRILFVSSVVGKRGVPSYAAYSGSKFALHGMADVLRAELVGTGVSVGVVCPSSTATEFDDRKLRDGPAQKRTRVQSHTAESVARAIVKMAASRRREIVLSAEGKLMVAVNAVAPGLMDRILNRALVKR
jgi:short-subunit dehydrogenase